MIWMPTLSASAKMASYTEKSQASLSGWTWSQKTNRRIRLKRLARIWRTQARASAGVSPRLVKSWLPIRTGIFAMRVPPRIETLKLYGRSARLSPTTRQV